MRILLENMLRNESGGTVRPEDIESLARWSGQPNSEREFPFSAARVLLQDFTGVPVRRRPGRDALGRWSGWAATRRNQPARPGRPRHRPLGPGRRLRHRRSPSRRNVELEYERNRERYALLRWAQQAFQNFRVVPPGTGIVHQVNLEFLASVVAARATTAATTVAFPDTLVGTDSHTTMINGLGVLGWGVGGIEAEAVLLGQPLYHARPRRSSASA